MFFKACCGCTNTDEDSQPYETARGGQSTLSPVQKLTNENVVSEAVGQDSVNEEEQLASARDSSISAVGSNSRQLCSLVEPNSFNPPLCSTKIGEGSPLKCLSFSAIEPAITKCEAFEAAVHSVSADSKHKDKMKPGRLRRITVSSPYNVGLYAEGVSEFDDTKVIIPEYHARSSTSAKEGAKPEEKVIDRFRVEPADYRASATYVVRSEDEPARTSCISTSTPYSESNGATHFVEFAKEMAENDRKYEEKMAKQNEDGEVDVEMPSEDLPECKPAESANDCESGAVLTVPSLTTESPAKAEKSSVKSLGDGYRLLDGSAKPLTLEESAELYANPPPTPIGAAPKDKLTSAAVKIRGDTAYFTTC